MECQYCGKEIEREDWLRTHIVSKHPEEVGIEKSKVCPFCGKESGSWYRNAMHISYKHGDKIDVLSSNVRERIKEADSRLKKEGIAYENNTVAPKNAIVEITQRCPLNCLHCLPPSEVVTAKVDDEIFTQPVEKLYNKYKNDCDVELLSYNDDHNKLEWKKMKGMIKHKYSGGIVNIETKEPKQTVRVTNDHRVPIFTDNGMEVKKAGSIKEGDTLIKAGSIPFEDVKQDKINLIKEFREKLEPEFALNENGNPNFYVNNYEEFVEDKLGFLGKYLCKRNNNYKNINSVPLYHLLKSNFDLDCTEDMEIYPRGHKERYPVNIELNESLARIVGYFVSEGSSSQLSGGATRIDIWNKDEDIRKDVKNCLDDIGWDYYETEVTKRKNIKEDYMVKEKDITPKVKINGSIVSVFFNKILDIEKSCYEKGLPEFVFQEESLRENVFDTLMEGDGYRREYEELYTTTSRILANQVSNLSAIDGTPSSVRLKRREKENISDIYRIRKLKGDYDDIILCDVDSVSSGGVKDRTVYDLEVKDNHNFFAGSGLLVKNCAVAEKETEELGASKWIEIFNKLHDSGIENLVIEGGEPTIHNDFYEILDYATTLFQSVNIQTSGVTSTNFEDFDCNVTMSFEYLDPWRNNEIRRMTDPDKWEYERENRIIYKKDKKKKVDKAKKEIMKFRQTGEKDKLQEAKEKLRDMTYNLEEKERTYQLALKKARSLDNPVTIRGTIYNDNDILGLAKLAEDIGANSVFLPLKPVGWGKEIREKVPSTKRMREVIKDIWHFNLMSEMSHRVEEPNWYLIKPLWDSFKDVFIQRGKTCGAGNERVFVNYKGDVTPCFLLPNEKMGNLFQDSVKSIFNNIYKWTKEKAKMANKRSCDRCMGGCIASMLSNEDKSENACIWKNFRR